MARARLVGVIGMLAAGAAAAAALGCSDRHGCPSDAPWTPDQTATGDVPLSGAGDAGATAPDGGALTCEEVCAGMPSTVSPTVTACSFGTGVNGQPVAHCTWFTPGHCEPLT
jgi:hypothetical protein